MSANNTAALAPQQKIENTTAKEVTEISKSVRVTCPFDNVNIIRHLSGKHNGKIIVNSEVGKGSEFIITIHGK